MIRWEECRGPVCGRNGGFQIWPETTMHGKTCVYCALAIAEETQDGLRHKLEELQERLRELEERQRNG